MWALYSTYFKGFYFKNFNLLLFTCHIAVPHNRPRIAHRQLYYPLGMPLPRTCMDRPDLTQVWRGSSRPRPRATPTHYPLSCTWYRRGIKSTCRHYSSNRGLHMRLGSVGTRSEELVISERGYGVDYKRILSP